MIENHWEVDHLGDFTDGFGKAYDLLYNLNHLQRSNTSSLPWRGGFSAVHFASAIRKAVKPKDTARIEKIVYLSPGYIRFELERVIGHGVIQSLHDYRKNQSQVADANSKLNRYIRDHGLRRKETPANRIDWRSHSSPLKKMTKELVEPFSVIDTDRFMLISSRTFERAQIARWFVRRVMKLWQFHKRGQILLPNVPPKK